MTSIDPRFAELIQGIQTREWLLFIRPNQTILSDLLGVSRQSVWCWENHKANISRRLALQFEGQIGLLGYFADEVLAIHADNQERRMLEWEREKLPRVDVPVVHVNFGKLSNRRGTRPRKHRDPLPKAFWK